MVLSETIISKHLIKPSVLTPNTFKIHKLSYLDQLSTPMYMCPIFFYENDEYKPNVEKCELLKQSLAKALTVFYPFSGIIKENSFVECNDRGVKFVEAQVHARLSQVIDEPQMEELKQLVPMDSFEHSESAILAVKSNVFDCGGMAVGVCLSHKVADFASSVVFMDAWASICRGETIHVQPLFDLALHFPPRDSTLSNFLPHNEDSKTQRFVFDKEKLEMLQRRTSSKEVENPTRVEALTVFLSQQFIQATKTISTTHDEIINKTSSSSLFLIHHAMNLRSRTIPPIPDHTIGNCISSFHAIITSDDDTSSDLMISKLRAAKNSVDNNFIKEVINTKEYLGTIDKLTELVMSGAESLIFTSLWRYPVYDVNFGWGKPIWVSDSTVASKNTITFTTTSSKDGIEAWINMPPDFLKIIEINYNKLLLN